MKLKIILLVSIFLAARSNAQDSVSSVDTPDTTAVFSTFDENITQGNKENGKIYHINKAVDYPITLALGGTSIYMLTVIYSKKATPAADILKLSKNSVPSYDRWTAGWYDANLNTISYYPFYAVMPLPLILLIDKKIAPDKGTIGVMYLESFAFEGILYTSSVYFANRYRPKVYDTSLSLSYRTNGNYRNSFFAGHVAVVANTTFFMSSVYMSYHPHSNLKWVLYGASTAATLGMSYLRLYAGEHFTSDIVTGIAVGVGCGLLTPALHKNKDFKKQRWSLMPNLLENGSGGFTFTYQLSSPKRGLSSIQ